ncbi:hypothetical protein [Denitratisoma oestradiolicum]|uniref:Uncharacterized protein n=1 Tax=Denitratisoma oestradiolicum TaxID=311182 RepID=A0A6S6Y296_9PROT|nr:hypothetical protein [Denitratisoma oestradiolicum]TWO78893.1 hypothetical protein CBW56_17690 [Denitratisoma oestradiolicum]CAB1369443.1 conserved protein of unknown function [Denitratisoma oestradiolicum]
MKIHQIPHGTRFEYEGEVYVKSGPMLGTGNGGQRLIPKYAIIKPLDGIPADIQPPRSDQLPREQTMQALEAFLATCLTLVPEERHPELESARQTLLRALG